MGNKRILIALAVVLVTIRAAAQKADDAVLQQRIIEQRIEAIVENLEDGVELDYTVLFDDFKYFLDHPLNLNRATADDLKRLYILSDIQIYALLEHVRKYGQLREIYELQAVRGWDLGTIQALLPFVKVSEGVEAGQWKLRDLVNDGSHDLFLRYSRVLEEQRGYADATPEELADNPNARYLGSPDRVYMRYRYRFRNNLSIGLTGDKDAGEEFFRGSQTQGFDFYSAHLYYEDKGWLRRVAIGDYQAQFGQGLTLWTGFGFGKSPFVLNAKRNAVGLRPYTSVDENLFFRGAAVTLGHKNLEFTVLYSDKPVDANVAAADTLDNEQLNLSISSFNLSGQHRTPRELAQKDAISERNIGGNINYKTRRFSIGLTASHTEFGGDLARNLRLYNQFEFNQRQNFVAGIDYNYIFRNINVFGEVSRSENGGTAMVNGLVAALDKKLSLVVMQRRFTRDYQSLYANAFAERGRPTNESGIYMGMEFRPSRSWVITGYADQFRFPWLSYLVDQPSTGHEYLVQVTHKPTRRSEYYLRLRKRARGRNEPGTEARINQPLTWEQEFIRLHAAYQVHPNVTLKSRVEYTRYQIGERAPEEGLLVYQDVIWKKIGSPVTVSARYALFDVETFNARLYAFESDVLYFFSIPAYFNRGSRVYAMTKIHLAKGLDLWLRYSRWTYIDRTEIGSGLEAIDGNQRSDFRAQLRLRF